MNANASNRPPVLGIDPGLQRLATAWATGPNLADVQLATCRPKARGGARLLILRDHIRKVLDEADPHLVMIEGYSFASRHKGHQLGEVGGVIRVELAERQIQYVEVSPSMLKQYLTGKGNASKDRMWTTATLRAGADVAVACDDEADALALFWLGAETGQWLNYEPVTSEARASIVDEIRDRCLALR